MTTWAWVLIVAFGVVKLPIACVMLWLPLRHDAAALPEAESAAGEDEGGSKTQPDVPPLPPGPRHPQPRTPLGGGIQPGGLGRAPRRGPHGAPASPPRTRHATLVPRRPRVGA